MNYYHYPSWPYPSKPLLRYVTDENGEIFYTGAGGVKIWEEDPLGATDVQISEPNKSAYYDLQGNCVVAPVSGEIYIEVSAEGARKIRF